MRTISRKDLLTPYEQFEERYNIKETRKDISKAYLGFSPSKYYETLKMDLNRLKEEVNNLFCKFSRTNPQ